MIFGQYPESGVILSVRFFLTTDDAEITENTEVN